MAGRFRLFASTTSKIQKSTRFFASKMKQANDSLRFFASRMKQVSGSLRFFASTANREICLEVEGWPIKNEVLMALLNVSDGDRRWLEDRLQDDRYPESAKKQLLELRRPKPLRPEFFEPL